MIDFHTHILPQIDDGSESPEMSAAMLKAESDCGVEEIVFTPHFYANGDSPENFLAERRAAYEKIAFAIEENNLKIKTHLGCEIHYFPNIGHVDAIRELAIDGGNVILLEPPSRGIDNAVFNDIERINHAMGLTVVIAHIERYINRFNYKKIIERLIDSGALIQSNAEFFLNRKTYGWAMKMLERDYIHILGSDCHNMSDRAPVLGEAAKLIDKKLLKKINMNADDLLN